MGHAVALEDVFDLVKQLPALRQGAPDRLDSLGHRTRSCRRGAGSGPRKSLWGLWRGLDDITEEDIAEARQEMWGNFPRDDIYVLRRC